MRFLQPSLFYAESRASSHVSSNSRRSSQMISGQFFLGLPLFPVHRLFGSSVLVHSDHMTQPRQCFPSDDAAPSSSYLVLSLIVLFGILFLHETCNILLSHLSCTASSLLPFDTASYWPSLGSVLCATTPLYYFISIIFALYHPQSL